MFQFFALAKLWCLLLVLKLRPYTMRGNNFEVYCFILSVTAVRLNMTDTTSLLLTHIAQDDYTPDNLSHKSLTSVAPEAFVQDC